MYDSKRFVSYVCLISKSCVMTRTFLLLVVAIGLLSFKENTTERNASIKKATIERVIAAGLDIQDVRICRVKLISERDYTLKAVNKALEAISGKSGSWRLVRKEEMEKEEAAFIKEVEKKSTTRDYGYYVRIKCRLKMPEGWWDTTMQLVTGKDGEVEIADNGGGILYKLIWGRT